MTVMRIEVTGAHGPTWATAVRTWSMVTVDHALRAWSQAGSTRAGTGPRAPARIYFNQRVRLFSSPVLCGDGEQLADNSAVDVEAQESRCEVSDGRGSTARLERYPAFTHAVGWSRERPSDPQARHKNH